MSQGACAVFLIEFIGAIMVMPDAVKPYLRANQFKILRGNNCADKFSFFLLEQNAKVLLWFRLWVKIITVYNAVPRLR
jgi:hypothetical protein